MLRCALPGRGRPSRRRSKMAATSAVRAVGRRSRRVFDIFVAEVPWTVSSSESMPSPSSPPALGSALGRAAQEEAAAAPPAPPRVPVQAVGSGQGGCGCVGALGPCNRCVSPAEELKEYFSQFGAVQRCQLPFVSTRGLFE